MRIGVFLSVIWLGELRYGVERMVAKARPSRLEPRLQDELTLGVEGRILRVAGNNAEAWGKTVSSSEAPGRPIGAIDAFFPGNAQNTASRWSPESFRLPTPQGHSPSFDRRTDRG